MQFTIKLNTQKINIKSEYFLVLSYALSVIVTIIVNAAGGTNKVYTNLMYIPIAIASSTNGKKHGIVHAIINALLVGPYMPLNVELNIMQAPINWILRMLTYTAIAYVIGLFADHYRQEIEKVKNRDNEIVRSTNGHDIFFGKAIRVAGLQYRGAYNESG